MKVVLRKLRYFNYFYKIKISINELPMNVNLIDIKIIDHYIIGYTNKKNINFLNKLNIKYNIIKSENKIKSILLRKWIGIVSFIIILILMFSSNIFIRNITFKTQYIYDEEVLNYVKSNLKQVGKLYLIDGTLNELNNKLRKKFNYYEFINLSKLNGNLIINIVKNDSNIKSEEKNTDKIVSNKDAYILKIQISSGNRNVELFQMVKKGDILISGESCKGYVIGRTIEIVDYKIPKVYKKILYTNNYYKNRYIKYKDQNKEFSIPFKRYYLMRNVIYKIGNFSLVEDVYFEQVEALIEYSIYDIEYYLYDYIKYLFYSNHHYEEEKIIDIKIVSKKEDEKFFYIKTINTALEELGQV